MSIDKLVDKKDVVYIHSGILLHKKEWNIAIFSTMARPRGCYIEWSKSERVRQIPYEIISMWNLKYDTNELIHKTERFTDTENKFIVIKGEKE